LGLPAMPLGSAVDILATDDPNFSQDDQQDTQIYEKHDNLLHGTKKKKWVVFLFLFEGNMRFVYLSSVETLCSGHGGITMWAFFSFLGLQIIPYILTGAL
jgi:hypothetical protein